MCTEIKCAVELYNKACQAEHEGMATLAEVYYLKSEVLFEQAGGMHFLNAANSLNALAFLRKSTGDDLGALRALRESLKIRRLPFTNVATLLTFVLDLTFQIPRSLSNLHSHSLLLLLTI